MRSDEMHKRTFVLRANANRVFDQLPPRCSTLRLPATIPCFSLSSWLRLRLSAATLNGIYWVEGFTCIVHRNYYKVFYLLLRQK
jgi:hypothetical protein